MPNFDAASMASEAMAGFGASGSPVTQAIWFESFGLQTTHTDVENNGVNGTVALRSENITEGLIDVSGPISLKPRPDELIALLPYIMGSTGSSNTFPLTEGMTEMAWAVYRVAEATQWDGCVINKATFSAQPGQPIMLTLDVLGKVPTEGLTFPSITGTYSVMQPFMSYQFVLHINSIQYECNNWTLTIDNGILPNIYRMSQTRLVTPRGTRTITLAMEIPHTSNELALYGVAVGGLGATLIGTNPTGASHVLTCTFGKLQSPTVGPTVQNRNQEIVRRVQWTARMIGSTPELVISLT